MDEAEEKPRKKGKRKGRYVYITERTRYMGNEIKPVDTIVEKDRLLKKLELAQSQQDWKQEAQILVQLGQLMRWKRRTEEGDMYLMQSAEIIRSHTMASEPTPE